MNKIQSTTQVRCPSCKQFEVCFINDCGEVNGNLFSFIRNITSAKNTLTDRGVTARCLTCDATHRPLLPAYKMDDSTQYKRHNYQGTSCDVPIELSEYKKNRNIILDDEPQDNISLKEKKGISDNTMEVKDKNKLALNNLYQINDIETICKKANHLLRINVSIEKIKLAMEQPLSWWMWYVKEYVNPKLDYMTEMDVIREIIVKTTKTRLK